MAQTMLLMSSSVSSRHVVDLKSSDPLLQLQVQRLRPKSFSQLVFRPLPSSSSFASSSSPAIPTVVALFKSKTKAPVKKVFICIIINISRSALFLFVTKT